MNSYTISIIEKTQSIEVREGKIIEFEGDALVIPADAELTMVVGISQKIWERGDDTLRNSVKTIRTSSKDAHLLKPGKVVVTSGSGLGVKYLFQAILPHHRFMRASSVFNVSLGALKKTQEYEVKTIALPILTTAIGGIPQFIAVRAMVDGFVSFFTKHTKELKVSVIVTCKEEFRLVKDELQTSELIKGRGLQ